MHVGQTLKAVYNTRNDAGVATNASEVIIRFYNPRGRLVAEYKLSVGTVTRVAVGSYKATYVVDRVGTWTVSAEAAIGGDNTNDTADYYVKEI